MEKIENQKKIIKVCILTSQPLSAYDQPHKNVQILYTENFKMLFREIKGINKWKGISHSLRNFIL